MRGHARSVAFELGLGSLLADTAELLTSELVTNAVHVSSRLRTIDPPIIRLWLAFNGAVLVIHVWDGSYEEPVIQQADTDAEMGRGLMIIKSLSDGWGSYPLPPGKVVWARIACGP
jgi:anti-sigma regulatory factor (Ser/Thr protein kinase)